jgi:phenylacetic acid degradation operon negative regulatory protein
VSVPPRGPFADGERPQPQDLVITLLGTYVRPFGDRVWSGGLVTLLGQLGFSTGAARVALTRLVRRGLLARIRDGRLVHYRLTGRAERLLAEGDGRIFSLGDPRVGGANWTMIWHQIPEERRLERSRLARRLRFLGFGSLQDSVWISPHDHSSEVEQLFSDLDVADYATVFLASIGTTAGLAALVTRAWDLRGVVERYDGFNAAFSPYMAPAARTRLSDADAFLVRTRLVHLFRAFPTLDPELPEELAPMSRSRAPAVQTFHALYDGLAEASQRHFECVTAVPGSDASSSAPAAGRSRRTHVGRGDSGAP